MNLGKSKIVLFNKCLENQKMENYITLGNKIDVETLMRFEYRESLLPGLGKL